MEEVLLFTPDHIAVKRRVEFEYSARLELLWVQCNVDNFVLFAIDGNVQLEDSFHLSILNKNPMVPQSSLEFYSERLTKEDNIASVVIMNGMTISLVGQNNNIIVVDGHLHGQLGAVIGIISVDKVEELLIFVKQQ